MNEGNWEYIGDLVRRGHADAEIEAVFAKYDLDGDRILDEEEQRKMQEDLEGQKVSFKNCCCLTVVILVFCWKHYYYLWMKCLNIKMTAYLHSYILR